MLIIKLDQKNSPKNMRSSCMRQMSDQVTFVIILFIINLFGTNFLRILYKRAEYSLNYIFFPGKLQVP